LNNRKKSEIANLAQGISVVHLYASQLVLLEVAIPHITEQAKIASFLSLIGERIQTQNKIIEELELLKDIVLKKILTRKLRFSEFTDEWNIMILGELCEKQASNISANKIEDNFGDYIIYGASGELKKIDFYEVEDDYISIVKDGAGAGRLFYCKGKSSVLGTLDVIKPNKNVNTYFLYCLLSCIDFSKHTTGSTIPHIYFKDYANERIEIPTIEEQQKISIFFSSIDTKMETEKKVLQQYESQKKYLLQNMFI
jgi:type I restriction enzyme S subunit